MRVLILRIKRLAIAITTALFQHHPETLLCMCGCAVSVSINVCELSQIFILRSSNQNAFVVLLIFALCLFFPLFHFFHSIFFFFHFSSSFFFNTISLIRNGNKLCSSPMGKNKKRRINRVELGMKLISSSPFLLFPFHLSIFFCQT